MILLEGRQFAEKIFIELKSRLDTVRIRGLNPALVAFLVGDDPASVAYINVKRRAADRLGVRFDFIQLPVDIAQDELCRRVAKSNVSPGVAGVIIQLPLPPGLDRQAVLDEISPDLDIDGLTSVNQARLTHSDAVFVPPTPSAIIALLDINGISLSGKRVVMVGMGELVGKPLSKILSSRNIEVLSATSETEDIPSLTRSADVVISAVGSPGLIRGEMIKSGAVVVDAGTAMITTPTGPKLVGDVDFDSVSHRASAIAPVPGGVGPLTVAMLFRNLADSAGRLSSSSPQADLT